MELKDFERNAHKVVDWMCAYLKTVERFPVKSQVAPGEIRGKLSVDPPEQGQPFDLISLFQLVPTTGKSCDPYSTHGYCSVSAAYDVINTENLQRTQDVEIRRFSLITPTGVELLRAGKAPQRRESCRIWHPIVSVLKVLGVFLLPKGGL